MSYELTEIDRRLSSVLALGVVVSVDAAAATAVVAVGALTSAPLPFLAARAGADRTWHCPSPGEQVLIAAPSGELALGVIIGSLYSPDIAPPANAATVHRTAYADGTVITYDRAAHRAEISCVGEVAVTAAATVVVTADGPVTVQSPSVTLDTPGAVVTGNLSVMGSLSIEGTSFSRGTFTTSGDVVAGPISVRGHSHGGIHRGGERSDGPS